MKESLYAAADIGATGIKMAAAVYDGRKHIQSQTSQR